MNLSTISTATIANLKSFARANNLLPTGDLRLKSTWLEVVQTFLTAAQEIAQETIEGAVQLVQEIATYDNARRVAKFTLKAMWSVFLVSIALVMLLVEAFQNRQKVMLIIREGVENRVKRLVLRYRHLELVGRLALKFTIVQPVLYRRDRVRLIIRNAISN